MPSTSATNTKLLLHLEGVDAATTTTDASNSNHTITFNGGAGACELDTAQLKFGASSLLLNGGTASGLSIADHADFNFGTANFSIDLWARFGAIGTEDGIFSMSNSAFGSQDTSNAMDLRIDAASANNLQFIIYDGGTNTISMAAAHGMSTATWYHIAVVRGWGGNANDWAITVAGSSIATLTDTDASPNFTGGEFIGWSARAGNQSMNGWIDEVRILAGEAGWTANFTPPTEAYTISTASTSFLGLLLGIS